jgi:hypothetical protein
VALTDKGDLWPSALRLQSRLKKAAAEVSESVSGSGFRSHDSKLNQAVPCDVKTAFLFT